MKRWQKFRNREYRDAYVEAHLRQFVSFQIRCMLRHRGWSQETLAKKAKITQGVVSRSADPQYGQMSLRTLARIAHGFDCALNVSFVPFSKFNRDINAMSDRKLGRVPSYSIENRHKKSVTQEPR